MLSEPRLGLTVARTPMYPSAAKEALAWHAAVGRYGLADPLSMAVCGLILSRAFQSVPIEIQYDRDSIPCRVPPKVLRRALARLSRAGWVHLLYDTTSGVHVVPTAPEQLQAVEFRDMWRPGDAAA